MEVIQDQSISSTPNSIENSNKISIANPIENQNEIPNELDAMESWTMLDDKNDKNDGTKNKSENVQNKATQSTFNNPPETTDGDISDGISVISETDSNRHSPPPQPLDPTDKSSSDECELCQQKQPHPIQDLLTPDKLTTAYQLEQLQRYSNLSAELNSRKKWNSTIILAIFAGITAIILANYLKSIAVEDAVHPYISLLTQRVEKLESENVAIRMELSRVLDVLNRDDRLSNQHFHNHKPYKHVRSEEVNIRSTAPVSENFNEKHAWTGDGPVEQMENIQDKSDDYCKKLYSADDLYADYNIKKCEQQRKKEEYYKNHGKNPANKREDRIKLPEIPGMLNGNGRSGGKIQPNGGDNNNGKPNHTEQGFNRYSEDRSKQWSSTSGHSDHDNRAERQGKNYKPQDRKIGRNSDENWSFDPNTKGEIGSKQRRESNGKSRENSYESDRSFERNDKRKMSKNERKDYKKEYSSDGKYSTEKYENHREHSSGDYHNRDEPNWYMDRAAEREKARDKSVKKDKRKKYRDED